ncbi:GNAT family N-acetyltransferase [Nocardia sp. NPDC050697]|uniref:GNAT family N-acetyltransferase n=1 Tax=Nocardia sp. NPDC050697 TaxID=3155158 RepID=UPI0033C31A13
MSIITICRQALLASRFPTVSRPNEDASIGWRFVLLANTKWRLEAMTSDAQRLIPAALTYTSVTDLDGLHPDTFAEAIEVYRQAFRAEPYREEFSETAAREALDYLFSKGGDLILGSLDGRVVALSGGYPQGAGYFIEEMAVLPAFQQQGIGRLMLRALQQTNQARQADWHEIRTTAKNVVARGLYRSEGFVDVPPTQAAAHLRTDGRVAVDERAYLVCRKNEQMNIEPADRLRRVVVAYPGGNATAVVFDQLLGADREDLNTRLIRALGEQYPELPGVEQCCFVTTPDHDPSAIGRMEMFGGEFCGNAARSVIWSIIGDQDYAGSIEVSGVARVLRFEVHAGTVELDMPLPSGSSATRSVDEGTLVELEGITHLVVTGPLSRGRLTPRELLTQLLAQGAYDLNKMPAVGVSYYDPDTSAADFSVWVRDVNTVFDETACGSGTSAIGIALAEAARKDISLNVVQPSGETIATRATYAASGVGSSAIAGPVKVMFDGEVQLS